MDRNHSLAQKRGNVVVVSLRDPGAQPAIDHGQKTPGQEVVGEQRRDLVGEIDSKSTLVVSVYIGRALNNALTFHLVLRVYTRKASPPSNSKPVSQAAAMIPCPANGQGACHTYS